MNHTAKDIACVEPSVEDAVPSELVWNKSTVVLWTNDKTPATATLQWDSRHRAPGSTTRAAAHVSVTAPGFQASDVDLHSDHQTLVQGKRYRLEFWARAQQQGNSSTVQITIDSRKCGGSWQNYGLKDVVSVKTTGFWYHYAINFTATPGLVNTSASAAVHDARFSFQLGSEKMHVWLDQVLLIQLPPLLLAREYDCGIAILSADGGGGSIGAGVGQQHTVLLPPGFQKLKGNQAPRYQRIIDDLNPAFEVVQGNCEKGRIEHGYDDNQPTQEEPKFRSPYFHQWAHSVRLCGARARAQWKLPIDVKGIYSISAWWPNATYAAQEWSAAVKMTVHQHGKSIIEATLDQRTGGDQFTPFAHNLELQPGDFVELECPDGSRTCIADAIMLESEERFNDGSIANRVAIDPFDGIVLAKAC